MSKFGKHVCLDFEDFKCLVRGGILTVSDDLKICLQDIGFDKMDQALVSAMEGFDIHKDHIKDGK